MTKCKKKKRQDDFQKVKLKVGKTKPKADNATNINFRTKGINLTEQLKKDANALTTHRKLNIKVGNTHTHTHTPLLYLMLCASPPLGPVVPAASLQWYSETGSSCGTEGAADPSPLRVRPTPLQSAQRGCCCLHRQGPECTDVCHTPAQVRQIFCYDKKIYFTFI